MGAGRNERAEKRSRRKGEGRARYIIDVNARVDGGGVEASANGVDGVVGAIGRRKVYAVMGVQNGIDKAPLRGATAHVER